MRRLNETPDPDTLTTIIPFSPKLFKVTVQYHMEANGSSLLPAGMYGLVITGNYRDVLDLFKFGADGVERTINDRFAGSDGHVGDQQAAGTGIDDSEGSTPAPAV